MSASPKPEDLFLQKYLKEIASSTSSTVFLDLIRHSDPETLLKNFLEIFSAAIKNPNINTIYLVKYSAVIQDPAVTTAIGSPIFIKKLLALARENIQKIDLIENILKQLRVYCSEDDKATLDNLKSALSEIEIIQSSHLNELEIIQLSQCTSLAQFEAIFHEKLPIKLHRFFKDQKSLKSLKEALLKANSTPLCDPSNLEKCFFQLDLGTLGDVELKDVAEFFNTSFPKALRSIQIVNENSPLSEDGDEKARRIIEALNCIKKSNIERLVFDFGLNTRTPEFNRAVLKGLLEIPTLEDVYASHVWRNLDPKIFFEIIEIFQKNTGIEFLYLQKNFEKLPYPLLITFIEKLATLPTPHIELWDWSRDLDPTIVDPKHLDPSKKEEFIKTLFLLSCKSSNPKHMYPGIISKEKEYEYLCEYIKNNSFHNTSFHAVLRLFDNTFSPEQRFGLVKTLYHYHHRYDIRIKIDLTPDQRLALFLDYGFILQEDFMNFNDRSLAVFRFNNINGWPSPAKDLAQPWVNLSKLSNLTFLPSSELDDFEPGPLKDGVLKLIPELARVSQTVWPSNPGNACLEYIKKRVEETDRTDRVAVFRATQLCQWYTYFTIHLATLNPPLSVEQLSFLSPVMKELATYPDRKMRCALSQHLFSMLKTEVGRKQYFEYIRESRTQELPYKILLVKISLNDSHDKKIDEEVQKIFKLLSANKNYKDGHTMRTFISGLNGLCNDKSLTSIKKLSLIRSILEGSSEHEKRRKEIEDFFRELKIRSIKTQDLKKKLISILGSDAESVLSAQELQKYFLQEHILKEDFNAIKRTITQKFDLFHHKRALSEQLSNWRLIAGLSDLQALEKLGSAKNQEEYRTLIFETFKEIFQLTSEELKRYPETFGNQRNEAALLTYLGRIRTLQGEQAQVLEASLRQLVKSLLTEGHSSFYKDRYETPHLGIIFKAFPHLASLWKMNQKVNFNDFVKDNKINDDFFRVAPSTLKCTTRLRGTV